MTLPSVYADLWCKKIFENATAGRNPLCRSVVNSASCELPVAASADCSHSSSYKDAYCDLRCAVRRRAPTKLKSTLPP